MVRESSKNGGELWTSRGGRYAIALNTVQDEARAVGDEHGDSEQAWEVLNACKQRA